MIGLAQAIGGAVLISFGFINIGGALISEGISDMVYTTMAGISGSFSWKEWTIQKSVSMSLSIMTAGIRRLASVRNTATNANDEEFEKDFNEMKRNLNGALGKNLILLQQFDNIRGQVISCLQNSYQVLVSGLKKSSSKYAKIVATPIEAASMINRLWDMLQSVLQFHNAFETLKSIIEGAVMKSNEYYNTENT
ncbi:unnamed protein product [Rotaria sp. Silwood2]|nr:unnamed protein product [Rotaria sp. Silwood2]